MSLVLSEELGLKTVMARQYGNLGMLSMAREDFDAAEENLEKSLELLRDVGRQPLVDKTQSLLEMARLRRKDSSGDSDRGDETSGSDAT